MAASEHTPPAERVTRESAAPSGGKVLPSRQQLFTAILAVRWISLVVASLGYLRNLSTHETDYGAFLPALAVAFAYTLLLSVFSRRAYELRMRTRLALVVDYSISLVLFSLTGGVWTPFLAFGACSFALAGLDGSKRSGIQGGLGLAFTYALSLVIKRVSWSGMVAADTLGLAFVYMLEDVVFSVAWAHVVEVLNRLDVAYVELTSNRERLATANHALDERQRQLMALDRIRHAILLDLDPEEIVRIALRATEELSFSDCRAWLLEGAVLRAFPPGSPTDDVDAYGDHPVAVAAHDRETVVTAYPSTPEDLDEGVPPPCVAVPVLTETETLGVVAVANPAEGRLTSERTEVLELLASQIALALEHARLCTRARDYAVAAERNRVTTEIHETVVRRLYDAGELADTLGEMDVPAKVRERLRVLKETILASLQDLRFAVLNWSSLEWESSPRAMIGRYAREFATLSGIHAAMGGRGAERAIPASVAQDLLRILQETLSNAWRHADATSVEVRLDFDEEGVELSVADDGAGFDRFEVEKGSGIGLRSIAERGARHGGTVDVTAAPGEGTRVRVWIPCR